MSGVGGRGTAGGSASASSSRAGFAPGGGSIRTRTARRPVRCLWAVRVGFLLLRTVDQRVHHGYGLQVRRPLDREAPVLISGDGIVPFVTAHSVGLGGPKAF
jgi:hypothetical protein